METVIRPENEMKDSGIEWVGLIPRNWNVVKNNRLFNISKQLVNENWENTQLLSLTKGGIVEKNINEGGGKQPESFGTYQYVKKDDIVLCLFDIDVSAVFSDRSKYDGMISPAYRVMKCTSVILPVFAKWWFDAVNIGRYYLIYTKSLRKTVDTDGFGNILTAVPSSSEQQVIADYLDETCSKIDDIIAEAKASIKGLERLKISQINKYTTHEIKKTKLKYITEKIGDGIHSTPQYSDNGTIYFINGGSFGEETIKMVGPMISESEYKKQNKSFLNKCSIMIALNGANYGNTSLYNKEIILLGKSAGYITLKSGICREYVRYCLMNSFTKEAFELSLNGTTIPNLSLNTLRNTEISLPSYDVQVRLSKKLKSIIKCIDSLITEKQSLIADLEAYKKSLIYEVVTGKRKVV